MSSNKEPVRCVVIGKTGSGKSALANALLGKKGRFKSDPSGSSVTSEADVGEGHCKGNAVKVVDTPGYFETDVDDEVNRREVIRCLALSGKGLHVFLYCIEIGRFTEEDAETFTRAKRMFGDSVTDYIWIVFTNKDKLDRARKTERAYIESAPPNLKKVLKEVGNKHIFINSTSDNLEPAFNSLSTIINSVTKENFYTIEKYKEGIEILKRFVEVGRKYKEAYAEWISKRIEIIIQFSELENELKGMAKYVLITKGSTLAVAGLVAAPVTLRAPLGLTAAAAVIGRAGGVTGVGATVADVLITNKRKKQINTLLKEDKELMDKLGKLTTSFKETFLEVFLNNKIKGVIKYVLGQSITRSNNTTFKEEVNKGLVKALGYLLPFLNAEIKYLKPREIDTKHDAGIVAGIVFSIITLPLDLNTIIQNSEDLQYLNTKHQLPNFIHNINEVLKTNMDDYDKDRDVVFIFVEEVLDFLYPSPKKY
ncbi:hypothetical protein SNE40_010779 [Patella caerulea]|uniref:AIG1-type G domain-containing protein n=1 Tax=Patella caerulea TaxID=87958 RepID=A0AAN8PT62_PATCE